MKLWSIQILRFFAALLVVYFHAVLGSAVFDKGIGFNSHASEIIGQCGVDIFFVISGFIIATTSRGLSIGEFVGRRAQRILPLHLLLALFWMIPLVAIGQFGWRDGLATWLLWPATDRMTAPANPVAWTLCFEVLFYAAFALTIWRRSVLWLLVGAYVIAFALRPFSPALQFLGNPIILEFLAGVGLAYAPRRRPAMVGIPIGVAILLLGAILDWPPIGGSVFFLVGHGALARVADQGVPAALIVWGVLQNSRYAGSAHLPRRRLLCSLHGPSARRARGFRATGKSRQTAGGGRDRRLGSGQRRSFMSRL